MGSQADHGSAGTFPAQRLETRICTVDEEKALYD